MEIYVIGIILFKETFQVLFFDQGWNLSPFIKKGQSQPTFYRFENSKGVKMKNFDFYLLVKVCLMDLVNIEDNLFRSTICYCLPKQDLKLYSCDPLMSWSYLHYRLILLEDKFWPPAAVAVNVQSLLHANSRYLRDIPPASASSSRH